MDPKIRVSLGKTSQWCIWDFRGGGTNLLFGTIFAENCVKMRKNWTERETHVPSSPFRKKTEALVEGVQLVLNSTGSRLQRVWLQPAPGYSIQISLHQKQWQQECIPVGCVPPAHWSYLRISSYPMHAPSQSNHACPPSSNHACPPRATMHGPPSNHACPLWTEWQTPVKT